MPSEGTILIIVSGAGFSTLPIISKLAFSHGISIPTILFFRFFLGAIFLFFALRLRENLSLIKGRNLAKAMGLGALGYAPASGLYLLGLEFMDAGPACVLLYTYPVFVVLISTFRLHRVVTKWIILALILVLSGIIMITRINPKGVSPWGVIIVLGASLIYSLYIIISEKTLRKINADLLTLYTLPAAAWGFLLIGIMTNQLALPADVYGWFCVFAISIVSTALPVFAFFAGLSRIESNRTGILSSVEPVFAMFLGITVLGEQLTFISFTGVALVFIGIIVVLKG